jgi:hypothetical protein
MPNSGGGYFRGRVQSPFAKKKFSNTGTVHACLCRYKLNGNIFNKFKKYVPQTGVILSYIWREFSEHIAAA